MFFRDDRAKAFAAIDRELKWAAKAAGAAPLGIEKTAHSKERYPELIPVLLDWIENIDAKAQFSDPVDRAQFLDAVARSLITPDARGARSSRGTSTAEVLAAYLASHPQGPSVALQGACFALKDAARAADTPLMARLAADRHLGEARAPILEWIIGRNKPELLELAIGELADPTVAPHILRRLAQSKGKIRDGFPADLAAKVRPLLDAELDETRLQARRLLERLGG